MINNESFKTISKNSTNIMNYLIRKLESREKKVKKTYQIFNSINSFEDFYYNKKNIMNTFLELEEDLKQASCAIKALLTENKALTLGIESKEENIKNLINDNNYLSAENENLKSQISMYNNNNNNYSNINNTDVNELYNISGNVMEQTPKIDKKLLTKITEENDDSIFNVNQLSNVRNIMKNMKNNKQKLKDAIEKHFITNNNTEINTFNSNNSLQISEKESPMKYNYDYSSKNSELLMKIMNNPDNINLLNYTIGKDFVEKIMDPNCPQEYLNEIENILSGNYNNNERNNINNNQIKKNLMKFKSNKLNKNVTRTRSDLSSKLKPNKKNKNLNNSFTSNRCHILNKMKEGITFEKSLRDYPIKNTASQKRFNNFTNPYGGFFD